VSEDAQRPTLVLVAVGLAVSALVAGLVVLGFQTGQTPKWLVIVPILLVIGLVVIPGVAASIHAQKRARAEMLTGLRDAGFTVYEKPSGDEKQRLFAPYVHLKELSTKHKGLRWVAHTTIDGRELAVFLHTYTVHTGQATITIAHFVAATPCPEWWPTLSLTKENLFHKIKDKLGGSDMRLESETFNDVWRVKTDNEDLALVLLTPDIQRWLEHPPKHESWRIGDGVLCCLSRASSKKMPPLELVDRVQAFVSMLPPEALADQS
jgi:hypothetical protein